MITVFTPAYNRAKFLPRLYESLCRQTYKDFEWVIVDDGSVDDTRSVVEQFSQHSTLNTNTIRYIFQENGGKHRAINRGVKEARGELFFIADSDDTLPPDALEIVARQYEGIKDDKSFAGVCGLDATFDGKIIGSGLPSDVIDDTSIVIRNKYGVSGDMKEVFRTDVLKEYPFPEIEGERFCPEVLLWNRIGTKYKLRYFNQVIYLAEYQNDGITAGIVKARMNSPIASMMTYQEMTQYKDVPTKAKIKSAINYWRFRCCANQFSVFSFQFLGKKEKNIPTLKWYWNWTMPIGWMMHVRDVVSYK